MVRFIFTLCLALIANLAIADIPERRPAISRNVDFFGSDLQTIFDTTLNACQNACLANGDCQAFTFNQRSNACFLKGDVVQVEPYDGAISARITRTGQRLIELGRSRETDLTFLRSSDLTAAHGMAAGIGRQHSVDENSVETLLASAAARRNAGDGLGAFRLTGAALSLSDASDLWVEYARLGRTMTNGDQSARNTARNRALPAAINGYLRARNDPARIAALLELAQALETAGRGRAMIPTLRLAQSIQPRRDIEAALEDAIGKYGFRVADTQVESDSVTPRLCAVFNEPLVQAGFDYAPFVQLPDPGLVVSVNDAQLCIDGVTHGSRYSFTLREGLPAASGETLQRSTELTLYVRDRSPGLRFTSRAYVLPRSGEAAIPVEAVNLPNADLTLFRLTDRNIIRAMQDNLLGNPLSVYDQNRLTSRIATQVWQGTVDLRQDLNRDTLTRIPMQEPLRDQPAGVYVLSAAVPGADPYDTPPATQWFILSDIGIASWIGTDGLTVMTRALGTGQAMAGAVVSLVSDGNDILGTARTDADGVARFAAGLTRGRGLNAPGLITVELDDDMAFLSLRDPAFDLSDRGVEGREPSPPIDTFLTTDRGAYRAGDTVHVTALLRDAQARALPGVPLTAVLTRPDGVEYSRQISTTGQAGGHVFALPTAGTAPRGTWRVSVMAEADTPLASRTVLIEDFLPERIDFDMDLPDLIRLGDTPDLTIEARYLFGPPAADLGVEGEALLRAATTLDGYDGYRFGLYDERFEPELTYLDGGTTGTDGIAVVALDLPDLTASQPLELQVTARVTEGSGRPVERQVTVPVLPGQPMIGIKPGFDGTLGEGSEAGFDLIALDGALAPQGMAVNWTVNRVRTRYQWYTVNGDWDWEPVTTRERIATGAAVLGADPARITADVDWGRYEIIVERTDGAYTAASMSFYAGWYAPAQTDDTPDLLEASLDADSYALGDTATFRIVPRYAGTALVSVMSDRLVSLQTIAVQEGENLIPLTVTEDWGPGAYVSASVIRPMDAEAGRNPARALGLGYAPVLPGDRALQVTLDAPEVMRPRQPLDVGITVAGVAPGDTAFVTLAAVDLGILNITGFEPPDPQGHYFGQRKLGVEMRDVYGRLIDGLNGDMGAIRSGGDAMAQVGMQSPPPTEDLVVFFQGPVTVTADGSARVRLDVPAFDGTLRLMAVAWSDRGVGQASRDVILRDPVVLTASVPRFLAPGDQSRVLLELTHADGPAGEVTLAASSKGLALASQVLPNRITLAEGEKQVFEMPFAAVDPGTHQITLTVTPPDGTPLIKVLRVPVLANDPEVSRVSRFTLSPGETFVFDRNVFAGLASGTGHATLSVGPLARFDAPGLLAALDRYPYGCTEQITSRAMPLLYLDPVAQAMGLATRDEVDSRIAQAIAEVTANQAANGGFGLWRPGSGDLWLDAYVTDFLSRARLTGHDVPDIAFDSALDQLRNRVNYYPDFDEGGTDLAYALMVLAREGAANIGDLRYYADQKPGVFSTALSLAQLGAALALYGDQTRADALFAQAGTKLALTLPDGQASVWRSDYGSNRRDAAAVLTLAVEAGSNAINRGALLQGLGGSTGRASTQEAAWTLMAANALITDLRQTGVTLNGVRPDGPIVRVLEAQTDAGATLVANDGAGATEVTVTTFGIPTEPEPAGGNGYAIERSYFTTEGEAVTPAQVAVGTRLVTVLTVQPFGRQEARLMVNDPLPAGFEIDNPNLLAGGDIRALDWLEPVRGETAEFRTDRFLAAVDWRSDQVFRLAYIVRAVSPGSFHHPAASVEDMYRPQMRARGATGQVTITP